jgi:hypothetical protein
MENPAAKEMSRRSAIIIGAALLAFMAALMAGHPSRSDGAPDNPFVGPPALATVAEKLGLAPRETATAPSNGQELRISAAESSAPTLDYSRRSRLSTR